ncbi:hypothetical protein [Candidatus Spongiihabitans sp.]|uniref:hypothetical protein n=1 Tax=Candidatus Spongiihabitans sp. TaxID=3101308 RepID=UPI003C6FE758
MKCAVALLCLCFFAGNLGAQDDSEREAFEDFRHADFDENSNRIDNEWWPLPPGKQLHYQGYTIEDGKKEEHSIIFTVTDLVKEIDGISTVVVWDRDFKEGILQESELAFFAQDKKGNVWHLGQYRELYEENGIELVGGRAWLVGHLKEAKAGIMMPANPQSNTPGYSQGYAPAPFYWTDRARVILTGQEIQVAMGSYKNVLVTEEFNYEEPGAFQLKYYAKGVGNVYVDWKGDDPNKEVLELVKLVYLNGDELAEARKQALQLEERNYIYGSTPRAKLRSKY